jgi:peptidoglycan/LPS O-acetylase OafA/YrhL
MTIVVMTASVWLSRLDSQSLWPAIMFDRPPSMGDVIEWGTLIGLPNVSAFNSVVWTLVVEIRLSMLLPLVIIAYRRFGIAPVLAAVLLLAVAADAFAISQPYGGSMAASISVAGTLHFLPLFAAGSALALKRDGLASTGWLSHRAVQLGILAVALTLYVRGHSWVVALATPDGPPSAQPMLVEDYIVGLGALLLVGLVASGLGAKVLASRPLLALGKASYSLYLWHLPVLVASVLLLAPHLGILRATGVGLCMTAAVTWFSYRYVEAPVQRVIRGHRTGQEEPATPTERPWIAEASGTVSRNRVS